MSSGYKISGVDLDDLLEPYHSAVARNDNATAFYKYSTNGTTLQNRYQQANKDNWAKKITLPYNIDGKPIIGVEKGCFPTQRMFAELTSPGTYAVTRTENAITIGSTSYPASSFRGGVVPKIIGIMMCGGGGGAGGTGMDEGNKSGYNVMVGAGGCGGNITLAVVNISNITQITIGAGGAGGVDGSSDSRPSQGGGGGEGGTTEIKIRYTIYGFDNAIVQCFAFGGKGGGPGKGDSFYGGCPEGYSAFTDNTTPTLDDNKNLVCGRIWGYQGGGGGSVQGVRTDGTKLTGFSFTTDAGVPTSTMYSNGGAGYVKDSADSYRASWASGGSSIGNGASPLLDGGYAAATKGGGGMSGRGYRNGANGYCALYY